VIIFVESFTLTQDAMNVNHFHVQYVEVCCSGDSVSQYVAVRYSELQVLL